MPELQERIVAHHVGARGFGVALNCPPRLAKDLIHVVYEADEECARQMIAENKDTNFHIMPYCLGRSNERAKLFICKNPYFSSNSEPNPYYGNYYCEVHLDGLVDGADWHGECYDVDYGGDMKVVRVAEVAVRTLDSIFESGDAPQGWEVDFLSLDTQGSELSILIGAERTFRDHCLALATEIEFHELYKNQALFAGVFEFVHRRGFHFAGFNHLWEFSSNRLPIGARDKGFVGFGDALFLRRIESVRAMKKSEEEIYLALMKLAFISLNFGYLEYAIQAVDAAEAMEPSSSLRERLMRHGCYEVVHTLRTAARTLPPRFPPTERIAMANAINEFAATQRTKHARLAKQRADAIAKRQAERQTLKRQIEARRVRHLLRADPIAGACKAFRYVLRAMLKVDYADRREIELRANLARTDSEILSLTTASAGQVSAEGAECQATAADGEPRSAPTTPVEAVLEEFGYSGLADAVRRRRQSVERSVAGKIRW